MVLQGCEDLAKILVYDLHNLGELARSPTTVIACQLAQKSIETQNCSRDNEDGLWRGMWVAVHKPLQHHLAGETSLLGDYRSPTAVAQVTGTSREMAAVGWKFNETNRVGPSSSHNKGPVHARVTVIAAPSGNVTSDAVLASLVP